MKATRAYRSPRRDARAAATADALLRAMADQLGDLGTAEPSLPSAAAAAGVGTRTAYLHFPDRQGRLAAVAAWIADRLGPLPPIGGAADLPDHCRRSLGRAAGRLPLARALAAAARAEPAVARRRRTSQLDIAALLSGVGAPAEPTARATAVVSALCAPEVLAPLVDGHGLTPADAVEAAAEAVEAIVAGLRAQRRSTA